MAADALQIFVFPFFAEGALFPAGYPGDSDSF
jgi:hypothetical protein